MDGLEDQNIYKGINMPNQNTTPHIVKDIDGHVIGCPHCGSRALRKDGFDYKASHKKQRWYCTGCNRKTLKPTILEHNPFVVEQPESEDIPIEDLIKHRLKLYKQK